MESIIAHLSDMEDLLGTLEEGVQATCAARGENHSR